MRGARPCYRTPASDAERRISRARPEVNGDAWLAATRRGSLPDCGSAIGADGFPVVGVQLGFVGVQLAVEAIYPGSGPWRDLAPAAAAGGNGRPAGGRPSPYIPVMCGHLMRQPPEPGRDPWFQRGLSYPVSAGQKTSELRSRGWAALFRLRNALPGRPAAC
jgi:hypothetical protein